MSRPRKFGNTPVVVDGLKFHSKAEAARYQELVLLQKAGHIKDLERQVTCPLEVNGVLVANYIADFEYYEKSPIGRWELVVEDLKGYETDVFKLKAKLFKAVYGFGLRITQAYKRAKSQRESKRQSAPPSVEG